MRAQSKLKPWPAQIKQLSLGEPKLKWSCWMGRLPFCFASADQTGWKQTISQVLCPFPEHHLPCSCTTFLSAGVSAPPLQCVGTEREWDQCRCTVDHQFTQLACNLLPQTELICNVFQDVLTAAQDYHLLAYLWLPQSTVLSSRCL